MNKSATASHPTKAHHPSTNTSLPTKSAWARGPPAVASASVSASSTNNNSRSQSPNGNPTPSHSRKPSGFTGPGSTAVPLKDGVTVSKGIGITNAGSRAGSISFGSVNDASAQLSSSPANIPTLSTDPRSVNMFGSIAANSPPSTSNAVKTLTPPASTPATTSAASSGGAKKKVDIHKLFQGNGSSSSAPSTSTPPAPSQPPQPSRREQSFGEFQSPTSPAQRMANLPPQVQPHPYGSYPQQNSSHMRGQNQSSVPRSPSFGRVVPNGVNQGVPQGRSGPPMQAPQPAQVAGGPPMGSPRMGHQQPPPQQAPPPMQMQHGWQGYYYYDPNQYQYMPPGAQPHWVPPPHSHLPPPMQHPTPHQPPVPPSPRPTSLPPPSTPVLNITPTLPPPRVPPSPMPQPPHTPTLSGSAREFVPGFRKAIKITTPDGAALDLGKMKPEPGSGLESPRPGSGFVQGHERRPTVRMESEETRQRRVEEEERAKAKKVEQEQARLRKIEEVKEQERLRLKAEEEAAQAKAKREEEERLEKERKAEEERLERERKAEEERLRKVKEEEERLRLEEEEKERERKRKEDEERERLEREQREKEEAEAEAKRIEEEKAKVEEEKAKAEAEAAAAAAAAAVAAAAAQAEKEKAEAEKQAAAAAAAASPVTPPSSSLPPKPVNGATPASRRPIPGPLDLSSTRPSIPSTAPLSALSTARLIDDLDSVSYPDGIKTPVKELNVNATKGKFRYDRDFLMQFMNVCKEKPDMLPPLDAIGLAPGEDNGVGSYGRPSNRRAGGSMGPPPGGRSASVGLGLGLGGIPPSMFGGKSSLGSGRGFAMDQFQPPTRLPTSEERFAAAQGMRSASTGGGAFPGGRPIPMMRSSSQGGVGGIPQSPRDGHPANRTRSQRGNKRGEKPTAGPPSHYNSPASQFLNLEPVAPLERTPNSWPAGGSVGAGSRLAPGSPEMVDRKVRSLLNKLTIEKFDSISDQLLTWANKSEEEKDGRTLIQVIRLVFEKATDEAAWSEMYARLCRKMMEQLSPNVQDESIKNAEGNPITGGQLFRKYLLNRCQEDFERGWSAKKRTAAAAAGKAAEDKAIKDAATKDGKEGEVELYSDEYYAAQKAKRQGLGLVQFIGELFKLQMLTERIMHECIKNLLSNVENPEEEEIESLCKLLTTVGQALDTSKARNHMDIYFSRMSDLSKNPNISSRMVFMIQDVVELRQRRWVTRNLVAAPTTIAQVHEAAAKEKAADAMRQNAPMSRTSSRRGDHRRGDTDHSGQNADGWSSVKVPAKAGDLSHFGKIGKQAGPIQLGPTSVFNKKDGKGGRDTPALSRVSSSSNMFSMLSQNAAEPAAAESLRSSSRPPSRKASVDLGGAAPAELPQRRKLNLLPRSIPAPTTDSKDDEKESDGEPEESAAPEMTEAQAKTKVEEDVKEFWSVRDIGEAVQCFDLLPEEHKHLLVDKLTSKAFDSKEDDVKLVARLFAQAADKSCSASAFEKGLFSTMEFVEDISIDVPQAYSFMARLLHGAKLPRETVETLASKINTDSDPSEPPRDKLLREYEKLTA
ncbi:hypothetical protein BOTBODRAFT_27505 [Botryobasidium botryosum FD-172 SS1]|uniref:MI domain-containing protein n=1 Tax=Botryobasidium botryosum (strain FD-172 SS1) TaxID=930990 RepID=A0A067MWT7_BOTB1|nr:hypothetical protein BOTBODRAFT_27505 [Botryobasidium botryosum FD-172 SS1]